MKFSRYLDGCVKVWMQGPPERLHRFLSLLFPAGLEVWQVSRRDQEASFWIKASQVRRLRPLRRRCRVKAHFVEKRGLLFQKRRIRERQGLFWGAILGGLLVWYLSGGVWQIGVEGCRSLSEEQVLAAARTEGVFPGCRLGDLDGKTVARAMQSALPQAGWIAVNTNGCAVEIVVSEREEPAPAESETPCNLVAECDGVITSLSVMEGTAAVVDGSVVAKGQLLVSGVQENKDGSMHLVHATAQIKATTTHTLTVTVSKEEPRLFWQGDTVWRGQMSAFSLTLPLTLQAAPDGLSVRRQLEEPAYLFGEPLPFVCRWEQYDSLQMKTVTLTEQDMRKTAQMRLLLIERQQLEGCTVLSSSVKETWTEEGLTLTATLQCEQKIGKEQEILLQ